MHYEEFHVHALDKLLLCVNWTTPSEARMMYVLLLLWRDTPYLEAIRFLGPKYSDPIVRLYAVKCLATMYVMDL